MSAFADLTAAPVPYNIDGVAVEVYPFTIAEIGSLCRACAMQPYKTVLDVGVDKETAKEILRECVAKRVAPNSDEFVQWSVTTDGIVEAAFLAFRKKLTREQVAGLNIEQLNEVGRLAMALTAVRQEPTDDEKKMELGNCLSVLREKNKIL